jgi:hypothetical protein
VIPEEIAMHFRAGLAAGYERTCGTKIQHDDEASAQVHARSLNNRPATLQGAFRRVEPYPCPFCSPDPECGYYFWHVGREMTPAERAQYAQEART